MAPDPALPTHQSSRVQRRRRVTYSWTRIIIIFFICLTIFTAILAVLIKFVILAPPEQKTTSPTTRASTTDALSTPTLSATATAYITTTIPVIPTSATTSAAHVASSTTNTNAPRTTTKQIGGPVLSNEHRAILNQFMGKSNPPWSLIFRATRDGFRGADFHRLCDHRTQTVVAIRSKDGYVFGGYARAAWNSSFTYTNDPSAFIYTLVNPNSIPPTRYSIKRGSEQYALYNNPNYGPTFGGSHDILVPDISNEVTGYTSFPNSYVDTTGRGALTFTGNYPFATNDIEVYQILG